MGFVKICVVGLGKIGLPLAVQFASKGFHVIGCVRSQSTVEKINSGESHVKNEQFLQEMLSQAVEKKLLHATTDTAKAVSECDVVLIIVQLVVGEGKKIDYSAIDAATRAVAKGLRKGTLVIYETSVPVGDTRKRFAPMLEESGLKAGKDFFLAYSPERVYSGRVIADLKKYPKIVGGINPASSAKATEFYSKVLDAPILQLSSLETAEFVKLIELVYRDVNIALANELADFCEKSSINIVEAISAANSQPFCHLHDPGIGVGGHCAPVYPLFLLKNARELGLHLKLAEDAREVNDSRPAHAVGLLEKELGSLRAKKILVLGLAYRGDVKEERLSPTLALVELLNKKGAHVLVHDPLFSAQEISETGAEKTELESLPKIDAVILSSLHSFYKNLDFGALKRAGAKFFLDGRNAFERKKVEENGLKYIGIGT